MPGGFPLIALFFGLAGVSGSSEIYSWRHHILAQLCLSFKISFLDVQVVAINDPFVAEDYIA